MHKTLDDVYETRRENLTKVLQHPGAKTQLATRLGTSQAHITHLLKPPSAASARQIREETARQIEQVIGLEPKALDRPADFVVNTANGVMVVEVKKSPRRSTEAFTAPGANVELPLAHQMSLLEAAVAAVVSTEGATGLAPEKMAKLARMVFEHALASGSIDRTYVRNLVDVAR